MENFTPRSKERGVLFTTESLCRELPLSGNGEIPADSYAALCV